MSSIQADINGTDIEWIRLRNDVNGNPRFACHFTDLESFNERFHARVCMTLPERYARAIKAANKLGGRKYHNKIFRGGIVFQAYECQLADIARRARASIDKGRA